MSLDYDSKIKPTARRSSIRDDVAYVLPMGVFLAFTQVGNSWPALYAASYVAKTLIVPVLLWYLWRSFTPIRWTHAGLGVLVGFLGIVQWIGMDKLLLWGVQAGIARGWPLDWVPGYGKVPEGFNPFASFSSPLSLYSFIAIRWAGASLVVPVMEELFWRDFVWRTILAPNDFKLAEVGEWDWRPFLIVPLIFAAVHVQWITAIVWALMIGLLLVRTKSLGACIIAHGVTNFLLGAYVLYTREWYFW